MKKLNENLEILKNDNFQLKEQTKNYDPLKREII